MPVKNRHKTKRILTKLQSQQVGILQFLVLKKYRSLLNFSNIKRKNLFKCFAV